MRISILLALLLGLFLAGSAAAQEPPATPALDPENILLLDLSSGGRVTIQLRPDVAPNHVARIKALTRKGFYNGLTFHRVIEGFMAQGGDPSGDGTGGSQLPDLKAEFNGLPHVRGRDRRRPPGRSGRRQPRGGDGRREQRQQPVLHHALGAAFARPALHRLRPGDHRNAVCRRTREGRAAGQSEPDPAGLDRRRQQGAPGSRPGLLGARARGSRRPWRSCRRRTPAVPPPPSIRLPEAKPKPKAPPRKSR
jgi:hypothetical protein